VEKTRRRSVRALPSLDQSVRDNARRKQAKLGDSECPLAFTARRMPMPLKGAEDRS